MKGAEGKHTAEELEGLISRQQYKCAICLACLKEKGYHVDHVVPLIKGGTNWIHNLQCLCPLCNLQKGTKDQKEFEREAIEMFL